MSFLSEPDSGTLSACDLSSTGRSGLSATGRPTNRPPPVSGTCDSSLFPSSKPDRAGSFREDCRGADDRLSPSPPCSGGSADSGRGRVPSHFDACDRTGSGRPDAASRSSRTRSGCSSHCDDSGFLVSCGPPARATAAAKSHEHVGADRKTDARSESKHGFVEFIQRSPAAAPAPQAPDPHPDSLDLYHSAGGLGFRTAFAAPPPEKAGPFSGSGEESEASENPA